MWEIIIIVSVSGRWCRVVHRGTVTAIFMLFKVHAWTAKCYSVVKRNCVLKLVEVLHFACIGAVMHCMHHSFLL